MRGGGRSDDLPGRKVSGLRAALRNLASIDEIRICRFTSGDVVRHSLVEKIINAYARRPAAEADQEETEA